MRILILNQAFYPDVVSTAQHATDLAVALTQAGHEVTVIAGERAYDDPARRFPAREDWKGIEIIRVSSTGLGKAARWRRATDFASFMAGCTARVMSLSCFDLAVAMTSPPLISSLAAWLVPWKARRLAVWVMDLNPDEAIAAGWLRAGSPAARVLNGLLRQSLLRADRVIVLDRFMKQRVETKGISGEKITVIAPWAHDLHVRFDADGREKFRRAHGLGERFVVMFSGNHSPCHPLDTLFEAAARLQSCPEIVFCFVGGGSEYRKIESEARKRGMNNIVCLPYQPLEKLGGSLSAADLHVVVMGDAFTGIVHPCKIYNILAVGSPFLYIGPPDSHVADIILRTRCEGAAHALRHGEVDRVVSTILEASRSGTTPVRTTRHVAQEFSSHVLLPRMIRVLETSDTELPAAAAAVQ